jgi:hypothetical protein
MANASKSSPALIALAWLLVGIPLAWGVYKSGLNAVKLFQPPPATAAPAAK